jgi:hypothetical protein
MILLKKEKKKRSQYNSASLNCTKRINTLMKKRNWLLLILLIAVSAVVYLLFYSTYNYQAVPAGADQIVVLNKRKIARTAIFQWITTPDAWSTKNWFSKNSSQKTSLMDELSIPDYPILFHQQQQPENLFHILMPLANNTQKLQDYLKQDGFHLLKTMGTIYQYFSQTNGLYITVNNQEALVSKGRIDDSIFVSQTAMQLFVQHKFVDNGTQDKWLRTAKHGTVVLNLPGFSECMLGIELNKSTISIVGNWKLKAAVRFPETDFGTEKEAILQVGITKPGQEILQQLSGFSAHWLDKLLQLPLAETVPGTCSISANWYGMATKIDSAISYRYDDNFNQVADTVINKIEEPILQLSVQADSVYRVFDYWQQKQILEPDNNKWLYTATPLVKCYAAKTNSGTIVIQSHNLNSNYTVASKRTGVGFLHLQASQLPPGVLRLLPENVREWVPKLNDIDLEILSQTGQLQIKLVITKRLSAPLFF